MKCVKCEQEWLADRRGGDRTRPAEAVFQGNSLCTGHLYEALEESQ